MYVDDTPLHPYLLVTGRGGAEVGGVAPEPVHIRDEIVIRAQHPNIDVLDSDVAALPSAIRRDPAMRWTAQVRYAPITADEYRHLLWFVASMAGRRRSAKVMLSTHAADEPARPEDLAGEILADGQVQLTWDSDATRIDGDAYARWLVQAARGYTIGGRYTLLRWAGGSLAGGAVSVTMQPFPALPPEVEWDLADDVYGLFEFAAESYGLPQRNDGSYTPLIIDYIEH